jgi:hypothetical protein
MWTRCVVAAIVVLIVSPASARDRSVMATAGEIHEKVVKLQELAKSLEQAAKALGGRGGKDLRVAAESLTAAADNLVNAARVYDDLSGRLSGLPLEQAARLTDQAKKAVDALGLAAALADDRTLQAFLADPSFENAQRWSEDAADTFARAAALVPDTIPFVSPMLKGYLSAPAHYVRAVNDLMWMRVQKIDAAANLSGTTVCQMGDTVVWKGALARIYCRADYELRAFMTSHRKVRGIDLYKPSAELGLAHLMNLVQADAPDGQKQRWLNFLGRQLAAGR